MYRCEEPEIDLVTQAEKGCQGNHTTKGEFQSTGKILLKETQKCWQKIRHNGMASCLAILQALPLGDTYYSPFP